MVGVLHVDEETLELVRDVVDEFRGGFIEALGVELGSELRGHEESLEQRVHVASGSFVAETVQFLTLH